MPTDLYSLVRPNVLALTPYRCARDDYERGTLLDANENSFGAATGDPGLNRYPDPYQKELKKKIAAFRGVYPDQVFTGVGSDEPIDLLIRIFCTPGKDRILITPPTYGMYKVSASINDVIVDAVPLSPGFQLEPAKVLAAVKPETKILFLCSPNNPTGNLLGRDDIESLLKGFHGITVIDEAYIDFTDSPSWCMDLDKHPNLVILQTLSKSFGMAGIRLGMAFASPKIIELMMKIKSPYNVNELTSNAAMEALHQVDRMKTHVEYILQERGRLEAELKAMEGVVVFPSDANFLLFRVAKAQEIYKTMADAGVVARYRGDQIHCENTIRVTVGTPEENNRFLVMLHQQLGLGEGYQPRASAVSVETLQARTISELVDKLRRRAKLSRTTKETDISVDLNLDGTGKSSISTGIPFYDHMLDQIAKHALIDIELHCKGDLEIDEHHTIEDTAIALGEAISLALGDKRGVERFGFVLPMDEAQSTVAIDLSGRPYLVFEGDFQREYVGAFPTEMTKHVFHSLAMALKATVQIKVQGENDHHKVEACFKGFARCLRQALIRNPRILNDIPSSKGSL
jgi:histidinol-phosphate aminotransferase